MAAAQDLIHDGARAPRGHIFDIQRFSIHDGPGIRTTVFFKGCPLRCPWCQNPESYQRRIELAWYASRCKTSGACTVACTREAIKTPPPRFDRNRCDLCGDCVTACGHGAFAWVGREVGVDDIIGVLVRDLPFYRASGGGVTLSGGEPTLQMELAASVSRACTARGIDVGLQTCGQFRWSAFEPLLEQLAFVQLDLKILDPERHRALLGGDVETLAANARALLETGLAVELRMPIVPGYTDDEENLEAAVALLRQLHVDRLTLMRYHSLGETKRPAIGAAVSPAGVPPDASAPVYFERAAAWLREHGLEVTT